MLIKIILLLSFYAMAGCGVHSKARFESLKHANSKIDVKKWENVFEGDARLAGVIFIYEYCDDQNASEQFFGKHPSGVEYVFWDGSIKQFDYRPDGSLASAPFWWSDKLKPKDEAWNSVDFSYGSDSEFKLHKDPRRR